MNTIHNRQRNGRIGALVAIWLLSIGMVATAIQTPISGVVLLVTIVAAELLGGTVALGIVAVWQDW